MKKNKQNQGGFVYSTDPDYRPETEDTESEVTPEPRHQDLRIRLDRLKGGKVATVITGFVGTTDDFEALGKTLRNKCGCGGSAKDGEIILQGDMRVKAGDFLKAGGYKFKLQGG